MSYSQNCTHANKEQGLSGQIAGSQLTAPGAADSTALPCSAGQTGVSGGQAGQPNINEQQSQLSVTTLTVTVTVKGAGRRRHICLGHRFTFFLKII